MWSSRWIVRSGFVWAMVLGAPTLAFDVEFAGQELSIRHERGVDSADVLLVYRDLQVGRSAGAAVERVSGMLQGELEMYLTAPRVHVDIAALLEANPAGGHMRDLYSSISVVDAGLFEGEEGVLSMYQHIRVDGLRYAIDLANAHINSWIDECVRGGTFAERTPMFDKRTRTLWRTRSRKGESWFSLRDSKLRATVPMTPASWSRVLAHLAVELDTSTMASLLSQINLLRIDKEKVVLTLGDGDGVRLDFGSTRAELPPASRSAPAPSWPQIEATAVAPSETTEVDGSMRSLLAARGHRVDEKIDHAAVHRRFAQAHKRVRTQRIEALSKLEAAAEIAVENEDWPRALDDARAALELSEDLFGRDHPRSMSCMRKLADHLQSAGEIAESGEVLRRLVAAQSRRLGETDEATLATVGDLARLLRSQERLIEAEHLLAEVLETLVEEHGPDHAIALDTRQERARVLRSMGRGDLAIEEYLEVVAGRAALHGPDHPSARAARRELGHLYFEMGRLAAADPLLREAAQLRTEALGADAAETLFVVGRIGEISRRRGRPAEGRPLLDRAAAGLTAALGEAHPRSLEASIALGRCLTDLGDFEQAAAALLPAHEIARRDLGAGAALTHSLVAALADLYDAWGKPAEAKRYRKMPGGKRKSAGGGADKASGKTSANASGEVGSKPASTTKKQDRE